MYATIYQIQALARLLDMKKFLVGRKHGKIYLQAAHIENVRNIIFWGLQKVINRFFQILEEGVTIHEIHRNQSFIGLTYILTFQCRKSFLSCLRLRSKKND